MTNYSTFYLRLFHFDALEGQAVGVLVNTDSDDPASQGTIQIRGASTINANNKTIALKSIQ